MRIERIQLMLRQIWLNQRIRYLVIGGWNTLFSYALFAASMFLLSPYLHFMVIMALGSVIALWCSFLLHKHLVFRTRGNYLKEFLKFCVVYSLPISANYIITSFGIGILNYNPYLTQAVTTIIIILAGYVGHHFFTFRNSRPVDGSGT